MAGLALIVATVGCSKGGSGSAPPPDAGSRLRAAAKATAAARSFEIVITRAASEPTTVDYQAPDRVQSRVQEPPQAGGQQHTVIIIGATSYESDPAHAGKFTSRPAQGGAGSLIDFAVQPVEQAADVSEVSGTFHFTVLSPATKRPVNATATLADGYLHELTLPFSDEGTPAGIETVSFSKLDTAPPVTAPPPAAVAPVQQP
ncbi:MAG: hypothetical protein ACYDH6_06360 [Acidimicrobiales bacterium]